MFRRSRTELLAACRELLTGCPQLVHINLSHISIRLAPAERALLLEEFLLDESKPPPLPRGIEAGARVAVEFDGLPWPGVVQGLRRRPHKRGVLFTVLFDDGLRHNDITRDEMTSIPWPGAGVARAGLELIFSTRTCSRTGRGWTSPTCTAGRCGRRRSS